MLEHNFRKEKEKCKELKRQIEENKFVSTVQNLVSKSKFIMILKILKFCRESEAYFSRMWKKRWRRKGWQLRRRQNTRTIEWN